MKARDMLLDVNGTFWIDDNMYKRNVWSFGRRQFVYSKLHVVDSIVEEVLRFGNLVFLDASPYEQFNFTIKKFIGMTPTQ